MASTAVEEREPVGVKLHPIALLSIVDHFERTVGNKKSKRCLGVLLGENNQNVYDVTNSYAVPFDEEEGSNGAWFVDHNFHETMYAMFKKINIKERILGWYVTGTTFKEQDLEINELWAKYCPNPVLAVIDVRSKSPIELPMKAFFSAQKITERGLVVRVFKNIPCSVDAFEPEEVGVEHLLRQIKDLNMNSLKNKLTNRINSLVALKSKIDTIVKYLDETAAGKRIGDKDILKAVQEIMSNLPKILGEDFKRTLSVTTNDNYLSLYVSSIVKTVINTHNLLNNRIKTLEEKEAAKLEEAKEKEKDKEKEKEKEKEADKEKEPVKK